MHIRKLAACLLAAVGLVALPWAASAENMLKVGAILALSGPGSNYGVPAERALRQGLEGLGPQGLAGHPVKLVVYDTEGNSTKAVQLFRRLADSDEVDVIVGPSTSGESLAILPVANQLKVPNITYGGAEAITKPVTPYVFCLSTTDRIAVEKLLGMMKERGLTKVGLIYSTDGFGQSGGTIAQEVAAASGIQLVSVQTFSPQDSDMTPQLLRIREADPQAYMVWSGNPAPTIVLRNAKQIGIQTPFFLSYANATLSLISGAGEAAEGVFVPALPIVAPDALAADDLRRPILVPFAKAFRDRWGVAPDQTAGHGLDTRILLEAALKQINGPVTRDKLRAALETVSMCGADGCRTITPEDHRGLDVSSLVAVQVRGGTWVAAAP